jgi:hypothetical protein
MLGLVRFRLAALGLVALLGLALVVGPAPAAAAGAIVIHPADFPDCEFFPGDVPGVDVFFPATCSVIITPSGNLELIAHAQLPAGYSVDRTVRSEAPCVFGDVVGTGQVVATPSGEVNATCHFKNAA